MHTKSHNIIKLLLFPLLVLRHAFFYVDQGYIVTEMGYNQSFVSLLLIPITASFGILLFYKRISLSNINYTVLLVIILSIIYNYAIGLNINDVLTYTIYDTTRRPVFLILVPIFLSYISIYYLKKYILLLVIFIELILYTFTHNFIVHYLIIFQFSFIYYNFISTNKFDHLIIIFAFIIYAYIIYFRIDRIGLVLEFMLAIGFIHMLSKAKLSDVKILAKVSSIRILDFYIIQAVLFTAITRSSLELDLVALFFTVFPSAIFVGYCTYAIREKVSYYR